MSVHTCCLKGFEWNGSPGGETSKIADTDTYVVGHNPNAAVLLIHDLFGWSFPNIRLLADHYAREANVTVYVPDFFKGDSLPVDLLVNEKWAELDIPGFLGRNGRQVREPLIFDVVRALRQKHAKVGAIGFCYGGWAVFRLGSASHKQPLVDFITAAHPSLLTKEDIDNVAVPTQGLGPEIDPAFTTELKLHTFQTMLGKNVPFEYVHFPGVAHACLVRGDESREGERTAMVRGKDAAVGWMKQFLGNE
ncbi:Dienelactone hydrolase family protein [Pleurostoma richardsiae]|uniref:Dienelactone hydrolase family protein n=1 Tax=Pleurostoma richardsiae TaxID=41990 RepID=A0AA38RSZ4_9PEZI|nr:Dienelactone hydrolase family protein [Pleurostoma richardsiae]